MYFYDNFLNLCNQNNISPSAAAAEIGLSRAAVNRWKNGGTPTDKTLRKIANYFRVDVMELVGNVPIKTLTKGKDEEEDENDPDIEASEDMVEGIRIDRLAKCADIVTMLSTTSDENIDLVLALVKKITGEQ